MPYEEDSSAIFLQPYKSLHLAFLMMKTKSLLIRSLTINIEK